MQRKSPKRGRLPIIYPYQCKACDHAFEVIKPIAAIDNPESCPKCSSPDSQRYIARTHFYGASDWDRAEYNPAFGKIVRNAQHRKELAKRHGMEEVGNEPVESLHKHYDTERERRIDESWAKV